MRDGATPCRRNSARNVNSSGARLLPLMRLPFLSLPSQLKAMSRLIVLTVAVATAINFHPASFNRDTVDFLDAGQTGFDLLEPRSAQIPNAFLGGLNADIDGIAAAQNDPCDRLRNR